MGRVDAQVVRHQVVAYALVSRAAADEVASAPYGVDQVAGPAYQDIEDALGGAASAAEAHGTLCGLLCMAADDLPMSWISNTVADASEGGFTVPAAGDQSALLALHASTAEALAGDSMAFAPLLPLDDEPLSVRAEALGSWCQGYLYGLAVRGLKGFEELPEDAREILGDLVQIARAGVNDEDEDEDEDEDDEEGESAYVELVEFVRVGVQIVYDQLVPPAGPGLTETQ